MTMEVRKLGNHTLQPIIIYILEIWIVRHFDKMEVTPSLVVLENAALFKVWF